MRGVATIYNCYMLVFGKSGAVRLWSSSGRCLDSRSSCVFGEGMQMSLVLLMLVIFDGFLIFQIIDSCFGSFWLFLVQRDSRGASGFYFGNGNRVAELHQSWLSGIYMLLWIVTEILSVLVFLITLHWLFRVLRPLCVCVYVYTKSGLRCCSSCLSCSSWCWNTLCLCHELQVSVLYHY